MEKEREWEEVERRKDEERKGERREDWKKGRSESKGREEKR